jgi:hypothetical protein
VSLDQQLCHEVPIRSDLPERASQLTRQAASADQANAVSIQPRHELVSGLQLESTSNFRRQHQSPPVAEPDGVVAVG